METIIISLGGSMIVPDAIDVDFLREFRSLILSHVAKGKKFIIVCGGGKTCRNYQDAARALSNASLTDLDWIGIVSIELNAELLRVIFEDYAHDEVIVDLAFPFDSKKSVIIGSAYEPGHSSDYDAVMAAKNFKAQKIINLSNIDHVYDSDPKLNPSAKKIEQISWAEYRKLIPAEWNKSGMSTPFDPIASKAAEEMNLEVTIMNGKPIDNLSKYLNGEEFQGTVIK